VPAPAFTEEHEIVPTVIFGVPVRPDAFVAVVAVVAVVAEVALPLKVAAVIVPAPAFTEEHEIVPTVIFGVPVRPEALVAVVAVVAEVAVVADVALPLKVAAVIVAVPALILLVLPDAVCLTVNVELAVPPLVISSLSVV
jgi:tetrahydromethanopterin S-methyltransferase subunit E